MAKRDKFASIDTFFVLDPYIQTLNANDRWLYLALICNPDISMIGVYELGLPTLELYTGLGREALGHSIDKFAKAGKIHYVDGWVIVKNHIKNNPIKGKVEGVVIGAHKRFTELPWSIRERLIDPMDSLYIPYLDPTHDEYIGYTDAMHKVAIGYGSHARSRALAREQEHNADGKSVKRISAAETPLQRDVREARDNVKRIEAEE